ncbi:MAG: hypothetical protein E6344_10795 [Clostridium sp.]|uniref:DUF3784 domain-containing protein n=1 Tax=Clostridium culturomicium TaxID=1499683 RepID=UPI00058DC7F2|nr:DUF3784 domain-containing protein [Clostridium culturomicium]MDU4890386.1 hypothetical protein [Clostridium sp.]MDU7084172.1 hypothetical protein [Clostridium sp.]
MWLLYIISGVVGISLIIIGYLIKYKKKTSLINDYKIKNIKNEEGYINWVGKTELIIGVLITLLTITGFIFNKVMGVVVLNTILIILLIILLTMGDKKYKK